MSFDIGKLASVVANCCMGVRELRVEALDGRHYFLNFENDVPVAWSEHWPEEDVKPSKMTDAFAVEEIENARSILQRHYDSGFLLGVWNDQYDGISYHYADGRYAELAERNSEGEAA